MAAVDTRPHPDDISGAPDGHELARHIAVPEERVNTGQAEQESALDRLRADMASRDTRLILAILGIVALATTIPGRMIAAD